MRIFFFLTYLLSGVLTATAFYWTNRFSFDVNNGYAGGNGNPGIFPTVFLFPFILFFVYGTIEYSMRFVERQQNVRKVKISLFIAVITGSWIVVFTFLSAGRMQEKVIREVEIYRDVGRVPLWSPYSNEIFFNPQTFLMLLVICYSLGAFWALRRRRQNSRKKESILE